MNAFRNNVQAAIPALRRYARALTRDAEIANDLVQDTLVRALRSEHLFHEGDVRSWLYTILTNLNRNRLRTLARRPTLASIEEEDAPGTSGPVTGARDIERALSTLVEDQRAALLLVVLEGLSYREVAEVQLPIGTVMSRLARARRCGRIWMASVRRSVRAERWSIVMRRSRRPNCTPTWTASCRRTGVLRSKPGLPRIRRTRRAWPHGEHKLI